ncbi:PREDICTED: induced myeloid leukemia cell differentiation protein Mcl-1, partial [Lepidothrix coronata]|uniref:Induced myeloid leukemia cell differentiation protein Mcl-1 n=1 Tax=Lepidothrix coronata TaxID=321398 RepID=A0A6J0G6U1_9PASS
MLGTEPPEEALPGPGGVLGFISRVWTQPRVSSDLENLDPESVTCSDTTREGQEGAQGVSWAGFFGVPGMLRKLELRQEQDLQAVVEVANHVFSDGVANWGRVVTLVAFGAFVARQLRGPQRDRGVSSLARILTDALVSSRREWLLSQGGWVSHPLLQPFRVF